MRALLLTALFTFLCGAVLAGTSIASADDTGTAEPQCHQVRPGLVQCTEVEVHGSAPRTFYLLARSPSRYESPPLVRTRMTGEVVRSVRRAPF